MLGSLVILAGTGDQQPPAGWRDVFGSPMILFMVVIVLFFFMMSRSNKRQQREREEMLKAIKAKDDVITVGGLHGRVVQITDDTVVLRIDSDKDVKITITRAAISRKVGQPQETR